MRQVEEGERSPPFLVPMPSKESIDKGVLSHGMSKALGQNYTASSAKSTELQVFVMFLPPAPAMCKNEALITQLLATADCPTSTWPNEADQNFSLATLKWCPREPVCFCW